MTVQQYLGRFEIDTSNDTIALDDNLGNTPTATITSGLYYIGGYTSEGATTGRTTAQLVEEVQAQIIAAHANFSSVLVTYNADADGKVKFVAGAGLDIDITFTDTTLRTILGYDADITGLDDTAQKADNEAKYVWRPNIGASHHSVQLNQWWEPESTTRVYPSRDGTVTTVKGNLLYRAFLEYQLIEEARVIVPSTGSVNKEFQTFFTDVIHAGQPIRAYPDSTLNASTSYKTSIVVVDDEPIGTWSDFSDRHIASYNGLWDISFHLRKFI